MELCDDINNIILSYINECYDTTTNFIDATNFPLHDYKLRLNCSYINVADEKIKHLQSIYTIDLSCCKLQIMD